MKEKDEGKMKYTRSNLLAVLLMMILVIGALAGAAWAEEPSGQGNENMNGYLCESFLFGNHNEETCTGDFFILIVVLTHQMGLTITAMRMVSYSEETTYNLQVFIV